MRLSLNARLPVFDFEDEDEDEREEKHFVSGGTVSISFDISITKTVSIETPRGKYTLCREGEVNSYNLAFFAALLKLNPDLLSKLLKKIEEKEKERETMLKKVEALAAVMKLLSR